MQDAKYQVLIDEIRGTREEVARIDRDLEKDRKDLENFSVQLENVRSELKQVRNEMSALMRKNKDSLVDALEPAVTEVRELKDEIKKKRFIALRGKSLFQKVKSKFKGGE